MREMNLCAKGFHRCKSTYGRAKAIEEIVKENLLNRQFEQSQIDAVWVTDITYISCNDGPLYLSTHIDLATLIPRRYMVDSNIKKEIVIHPLQIYKGELGTVIHSDRGSQYQSLSYQELLTDLLTTSRVILSCVNKVVLGAIIMRSNHLNLMVGLFCHEQKRVSLLYRSSKKILKSCRRSVVK
ncbi:hypothetical protein KQI58_16000 [Enterococcus raffinosus]|uniref:DDE-type integrase/transposase/recombinase n=1 Tax=Enterococcus raffinosus TaxID=71452 RepID=UPI001C0F69FD|nr:DDE-type integrase/transposase/recombinase [Enterococcus raffinosus]MBU5362577.1 hypothetical protein [Enterococcus raffinosus]